MFPPSNELFMFVSTDCPLVKMISYCLNPTLVLNLYAAIALQFMTILVANSLSIKILLSCCLFHLLVHIYVFYNLEKI